MAYVNGRWRQRLASATIRRSSEHRHDSPAPPIIRMAIAEGVTEIQDSEDEPLSSSPIKLPEIHVDKLSAEESGAHQEPQDATQDCHGTHQAYAKHVGADFGDLTRSAVDRNHSLGVFEIESNNEIQSNVSTQQEGATIELNRKYLVSDEALGMNNEGLNERLDFGQSLATAKLAFDIEGLEQLPTSHVFSETVGVARHVSPRREHCGSSTTLCTPLLQAAELSTTPKLECMGDRSQQVHANNKAQTEVSQPDNDTVSGFAVCPEAIPDLFHELTLSRSMFPIHCRHLLPSIVNMSFSLQFPPLMTR